MYQLVETSVNEEQSFRSLVKHHREIFIFSNLSTHNNKKTHYITHPDISSFLILPEIDQSGDLLSTFLTI